MDDRILIVTGGSSGLGREIIKQAFWAKTIYNISTTEPFLQDWQPGEIFMNHDVTIDLDVDEWDEDQIFAEADTLVNCAGINFLSPFEYLTCADYDNVIRTNLTAPIFLTQRFLAQRPAGKTVVNIISNASHQPMTHSLAYNVSKAGLHMATQQIAREMSKKGATIFGVSPTKLAGTGMSRDIEVAVRELRGWTEEEAAKYQLDALVSGDELAPEYVAMLICYLLEHPAEYCRPLTGCILPIGAVR